MAVENRSCGKREERAKKVSRLLARAREGAGIYEVVAFAGRILKTNFADRERSIV